LDRRDDRAAATYGRHRLNASISNDRDALAKQTTVPVEALSEDAAEMRGDRETTRESTSVIISPESALG
jgi:hypothetical protein